MQAEDVKTEDTKTENVKNEDVFSFLSVSLYHRLLLATLQHRLLSTIDSEDTKTDDAKIRDAKTKDAKTDDSYSLLSNIA
jgi:hypothetical protein